MGVESQKQKSQFDLDIKSSQQTTRTDKKVDEKFSLDMGTESQKQKS